MIIKSIVFVVLGFSLLIKGADFLVSGASNIAKKQNIPEMMIGLTIVSIGTSMPELVVSITSVFKGYQDIIIGNVIGSNLANLLLILGVTSFIAPITIHPKTQENEIPICLLVTLFFTIICIWAKGISREIAVLFLLFFILFLGRTVYLAKKSSKEQHVSIIQPSKHLAKDIFLILLGVIGLKVGGDLTIDNAITLASIWGVSEKIISITILSLGTSLPELVTCIIAAMKGSNDIAIGNVLGSNIFNISLIVGTSAFIRPIAYSSTYNIDSIVLLFATLLMAFFPLFAPKNKMGRNEGILYMYVYTLYLTMSFYNA